MNMEYECICDGRRWNGSIDRFEAAGDIFYARLSGRESGIDVICGRDPAGISFICLPDHDAGCRIAPLTDVFWNAERLTPLIGEVDAITVSNGPRMIANIIKSGYGR